MTALLKLDAVDTFHDRVHIPEGLTLEIASGKLVCLLGGNASGKSTTLKKSVGIVRRGYGSVDPLAR